jgi:hypothetical protein
MPNPPTPAPTTIALFFFFLPSSVPLVDVPTTSALSITAAREGTGAERKLLFFKPLLLPLRNFSEEEEEEDA